MKAIFMGGNSIYSVYNTESYNTLKEKTGLEYTIISKQEVIDNPSKFEDTEYIFSTWGMPIFTTEEIKEYLPSLKCLFYGAGSVQPFARPFLDNGVKVFSAWAANAVPVAEYTVSQIILANKGFYLATKMINDSTSYQKAREYSGTLPGNYGASIGIIGAGMIGKLVIKMLKSYNLNVQVYDPFLSDEKANELQVKKVSLEDLFTNCQVISNHVANLPQTVGMLNYDLFKLMKPNAVFINTGRGAQVVETDLIRVLEEKPFITAVLDVTMPEPAEDGSKLYSLSNVFLTPHIAGSAGLEVQRMGEYMVTEYIKYSEGIKSEYEVTLKMLETMA